MRRERRILFDGVRAEIHPYDVTVERDGTAEAYDCKWGARGINADVLNQLDDARTHAAEEDEHPDGGAGRVRRPAVMRRSPGPPDGAHRGIGLVSLESLDRPGGALDGRPATPARWTFRVRFDEAGPGRSAANVQLLRYAQDLASFHSAERGFDRAWYAERGLAWLARAAAVAVLAPIAHGSTLTGTTRVVGERRVWARRRTEFVDPAGTAHRLDRRRLGPSGCARRADPDPARVRACVRDARRRHSRSAGCPWPAPPDARTPRFEVRPQELDPMDHVNNAVYADWLDEAVWPPGHRPRPGPPTPRRDSSTRDPAEPAATRDRDRLAGRCGWATASRNAAASNSCEPDLSPTSSPPAEGSGTGGAGRKS